MESSPTPAIMAVFAHPDDEAYSCAGTLARAVRAGVPVGLVAATRGEAGFDLHAGLAPGPALANKRSAELAASCRALGVQAPRFLDLPDGDLEAVDPAHGAARLSVLMAEIRPAVVIGLGADGVYGHRDHLAVHAWLRAAVDALPSGARPRLLEAAFPAGLFAPAYRRLRERHPAMVAAEAPAAGFGAQRGAADLVVDIRALQAEKRAALAAHRSQTRPGGRFILPGVEAQLMDEEWFHLAAGPALPKGAGDPLAGL